MLTIEEAIVSVIKSACGNVGTIKKIKKPGCTDMSMAAYALTTKIPNLYHCVLNRLYDRSAETSDDLKWFNTHIYYDAVNDRLFGYYDVKTCPGYATTPGVVKNEAYIKIHKALVSNRPCLYDYVRANFGDDALNDAGKAIFRYHCFEKIDFSKPMEAYILDEMLDWNGCELSFEDAYAVYDKESITLEEAIQLICMHSKRLVYDTAKYLMRTEATYNMYFDTHNDPLSYYSVFREIKSLAKEYRTVHLILDTVEGFSEVAAVDVEKFFASPEQPNWGAVSNPYVFDTTKLSFGAESYSNIKEILHSGKVVWKNDGKI